MKSENSRLNNWINSSLIGVGGSRSGFITTKGETNTNRKDSAAAKWLQAASEGDSGRVAFHRFVCFGCVAPE